MHGIPCTTPSRTILDLAGVLQRRRLERLPDQAEAEELLDLGGLTDQLAHNAHTCAASAAPRLDEHRVGSTATDTELEELFLASRSACPILEIQSWLDLGDGEQMIRPDFLWRAQRVIVETDGAKHHRSRRRFETAGAISEPGLPALRRSVTKRQPPSADAWGAPCASILAARSGSEAAPGSQPPANPATTSLPEAA